MTPTFRQQCALILLEKWADKVFDKQFQREANDAGLDPSEFLVSYIEEAVDVFEKQLIAEALERSGGSRKEAARILGIHRNTLQKKFS